MITCKYSCHQCGLKNREVDVPTREPGEEIVHWMKHMVIRSIQNDHIQQSPECKAKQIDELMIPVSPVGIVGVPTVH